MSENLIVKDSEIASISKDLVHDLDELVDISNAYVLCLQNVIASAYTSVEMESAVNDRCGRITTATRALKDAYASLGNVARTFVEEISVIDGIV